MNATLSRLYSRAVLPQYVRRSSFRACPHAASSCLRHCFGWPGTVLPDHVAGLKLSFSFSRPKGDVLPTEVPNLNLLACRLKPS